MNEPDESHGDDTRSDPDRDRRGAPPEPDRQNEDSPDASPEEPPRRDRTAFAETIHTKEQRKVDARGRRRPGIIAGMGMFGLVGWSVAIPTLLCLALGIWIDAHANTRFSWTLMLLVVGIFLGSMTAWYWVREESQRRP